MKANNNMDEFFYASKITVTEPGDPTPRPLLVMSFDDWVYWENYLDDYEAAEKAEAEAEARAMKEAWIAEAEAEAAIERLADYYWEERSGRYHE
jgi:hypothetical protein